MPSDASLPLRATLSTPVPGAARTLWLLSLLSALAFMDRQILAVLTEPVKAEFGLSDLHVGLVTGLASVWP